MKLKYYLRGVGAGIIFATVILSVSYHVSSKTQLSDAEIIKKAEELGMVKQSDLNMDDLIAPSATPTAEPSLTPTAQQGETQIPDSTDAKAEESTQEPADEQSKDESGDTDVESVATSEVDNEADDKNVSFRIDTGMTSEAVSKLLKNKGIIEDTRAFNQYLKQNGFTTEINIGEFQIEKFASYQDIADIIVNK